MDQFDRMVDIMDQIMFLLRGFLLILSFYGYIQYLQKRIRLEFTISILFCGIGSVMVFAGILNILPETAWVIFAFGIYLAVKSLRRKERIMNVLSIGTVFWVVLSAFFLLLLHGSEFTHYDNFSHWAVAPKIMIRYHRFPNFSNQNLTFAAYPLGSASFIYYITKILGITSEWVQMYAQAVLMTGMLISMFAFCEKPYQALLAGLGSLLLLCGNTSFVDLLVDSLLPITALSAMAFCIYYGRDLVRRMWAVVPYSIFLLSIKNSGILFAVILLYYTWRSTRLENITLKKWLFVLIPPASALILWQKHVDLVFSDGLLSKHSMSVSNYSYIFVEKNFSEIITIVQKMVFQTCSFSNRALWALLFGLVLCVFFKYLVPESGQTMKKTFLLAVAVYVLYQLGTLGMYLFSMPGSEALSLAGYSRYHQTIVMYVTGLIIIETMQGLAELQSTPFRTIRSIATVIVALTFIYYTLAPNLSFYRKQNLEKTERYKFDQLIAQYDIQEGLSYLILASEDRNDGGYLYFMSKYLLDPAYVLIQPGKNLSQIHLSDFDYVIAFEETDEIWAFLSEISSANPAPVVNLHEKQF